MLGSYEHDPAVHRIIELPVSGWLRRELKRPELVTYHHQVFGTWVVALFAEGRLFDIGMLGSGEGEGPWLNRKAAVDLMERMHLLITALEAKKRMRDFHKAYHQTHEQNQLQQREAHRAIYKYIQKRSGTVKAERYAMATVPGLLKEA